MKSTEHDKQCHLLLGLADKGLRAAVAFCESSEQHAYHAKHCNLSLHYTTSIDGLLLQFKLDFHVGPEVQRGT